MWSTSAFAGLLKAQHSSYCCTLASDRSPKFIQQLTASPRFLAGENVHCDTAATTASSTERPPSERLSRETRKGCPVCETSTRTTTTSWENARRRRGGAGLDTRGHPRRFVNIGEIEQTPAGGVGATIRGGSGTGCGSTTGDAANPWTTSTGTGCRAIGRGVVTTLRAVSRACGCSPSSKECRALRPSVERTRRLAALEAGPRGSSLARRLPGLALPRQPLSEHLALLLAVVQAALGVWCLAKHPAEHPWQRPR